MMVNMPAPDYAVEYSACRSRIRVMLADVSVSDAAVIVPTCPDWTVRDVCAHIAGVSAALVARGYNTSADCPVTRRVFIKTSAATV